MVFGLLNLSLWGYVVATLILTQITIAGVTLYLHRCQSHRALDLHPIVSHFFRFWLWMTTGMVTAEWVAIHRKHHAMTDVEGDPHSPRVEGLKKILAEGAELYRSAAKDKAMVAKYAHGTPNDWIERNLYSRYSALGISLLFVLYLILFGLPGITLWAIQMMWIPLHAAGVINGVGHHSGYRNFECADASTNIIPWGFWIGGEELHNNHHTFASSAKFSVKWWEFDIGWLYIRCLCWLGLAKVRKLPPQLIRDKNKLHVDLETVRAVIGNRFQVMSHYYNQVIRPILKQEKKQSAITKTKRLPLRAGRLLRLQEELLSQKANARLQSLLSSYEQLQTVYRFRQSLQNVWQRTATSQKELVEALQQWCKQAEESGLETLRQFALQIKGYVSKPAAMP
ncbi:MAG: fatty acid desaturase [Legionella sp.]|nr:fatty acid desaturase [Legionella sp.]